MSDLATTLLGVIALALPTVGAIAFRKMTAIEEKVDREVTSLHSEMKELHRSTGRIEGVLRDRIE